MDPITTLATRLGEHLRQFNAQVTTAESCTGGGIAEAITRIPGSSAWFPTDVKTKSAAPTTVGEILLFEFLKPLGISAYELSIKMDISYKRMIDILQNESSITDKECLSLSVIFNTDVYFWWNLYNNYKNWMQCKNIL